jgi:hypothetical protein
MTRISLIITFTLLTLNVHAEDMNTTEANATAIVKPYYQGEVMSVENGGSYTYLEVKEHTEATFWVAVNAAEVNVGDYVRFQKELITQNFKSKALDRTFKELMFGSNLQYKIQK